MSKPVLEAVAIMRPITTGSAFQDELHDLIARFARVSLYSPATSQATIKRLSDAILARMVTEWLPEAQQIGARAAVPILEPLLEQTITKGDLLLTGPVARSFRKFHGKNLGVIRRELRTAAGQLSGEAEAALLRGSRDGQARREVISDLVEADRAEMRAIGKARRRLDKAGEALQRAEVKLERATGAGPTSKARKGVRLAKAERRKATAAVNNVKSSLARYETAVQGHARDVIRHEGHEAQFSAFKQQGFRSFAWVTVNGSDACPTCEERHGQERTAAAWRGDGPGDGTTFCQFACMCQLVPVEFREKEGIDEPVKIGSAT